MQSEMNRRMSGERKEKPSLSLSVLVIVVIKVHGEEKGEIRRWGTTNKAAGSEGRSVGVGGWVDE